jgi:hypothetical protein
VSIFSKLFGKPPSAPPASPGELSPEFEKQLEISRHYLNDFTQLNTNGWGYGSQSNFSLSQTTGLLRFDFEDGRAVEAPYQAIGSLNPSVGTWAWAWAAPGIDPSLTVDANRMRLYGGENGVAALTTPEYPADIKWAWNMVAFAARACEAKGAFGTQFGPMQLFVTFGDVRFIEPVP